MTREQAPKSVPFPLAPNAAGTSATLLSGEEIRRDLERFLAEAYRGAVELTVSGQLHRLYASHVDALARLLCLMIDRLCHSGPIHLHLCDVPGALELSLTLPTRTLPTPELQQLLLSVAAAADVALHARSQEDTTVYTLGMREDYKLPTLRAAGGESFFALLMRAWADRHRDDSIV